MQPVRTKLYLGVIRIFILYMFRYLFSALDVAWDVAVTMNHIYNYQLISDFLVTSQ